MCGNLVFTIPSLVGTRSSVTPYHQPQGTGCQSNDHLSTLAGVLRQWHRHSLCLCHSHHSPMCVQLSATSKILITQSHWPQHPGWQLNNRPDHSVQLHHIPTLDWLSVYLSKHSTIHATNTNIHTPVCMHEETILLVTHASCSLHLWCSIHSTLYHSPSTKLPLLSFHITYHLSSLLGDSSFIWPPQPFSHPPILAWASCAMSPLLPIIWVDNHSSNCSHQVTFDPSGPHALLFACPCACSCTISQRFNCVYQWVKRMPSCSTTGSSSKRIGNEEF